ncbi:hypothetical protein [Nannocystis radixulma]|uniref:Uncharacterized protein n=1 Tax=Nannocystis radixulma TaxID=2995305 RepID=A0ABT5BE71_9BACT|nr:hypothetical protein [Nannocystis radixulma]MDC0672436.1 hypothetical protein [Nannocystis radixulma]
MLTAVFMAALLSTSSPDDGGQRPRLTDYLDEICADAPDGACAPLYALVESIELLAQPGGIDAGSWCCNTCTPGTTPSGPKVTCQGCAQGGKSWKCGGNSIKFADRPVHLDCPGTTVEAGETVSCY